MTDFSSPRLPKTSANWPGSFLHRTKREKLDREGVHAEFRTAISAFANAGFATKSADNDRSLRRALTAIFGSEGINTIDRLGSYPTGEAPVLTDDPLALIFIRYVVDVFAPPSQRSFRKNTGEGSDTSQRHDQAPPLSCPAPWAGGFWIIYRTPSHAQRRHGARRGLQLSRPEKSPATAAIHKVTLYIEPNAMAVICVMLARQVVKTVWPSRPHPMRRWRRSFRF